MRKERRLVFNPDQWLVEKQTFSMYMCHCRTTQSTDTVFIHKQKTWPHITIDKPWNTKCFDLMDWKWEYFYWSDYHQSPESKIEETRLKTVSIYTAVQIREDPFAHSWGTSICFTRQNKKITDLYFGYNQNCNVKYV